MLDLEQQLTHERETNALLRLELQELESQLRVYRDSMSQLPREARPVAWQDVVAVVWWTAVGMLCLKLLVEWVGWERFGLALGVLFWVVVFVVWLDPGKFAARIRSRARETGERKP